MESLWNDRWARTAALLIVGGFVTALALEIPPVAAGIVHIIGLRWTLMLVFGVVLLAILLLFPGWWPLWRARRNGLSNAWVFALLCWGLSTAGLEAVLALVLLPMAGFQVLFAPQLQYDGVLSGDGSRILRYAINYWWMALPLLQVLGSLWVTRWLARRWPSIDRAMGEGNTP